jgi:hypothetical protein
MVSVSGSPMGASQNIGLPFIHAWLSEKTLDGKSSTSTSGVETLMRFAFSGSSCKLKTPMVNPFSEIVF